METMDTMDDTDMMDFVDMMGGTGTVTLSGGHEALHPLSSLITTNRGSPAGLSAG